MDVISKIAQKDMGTKVISLIESKLGPLPSSGLLAGQAVSSALCELLGTPMRGKYKDADVFIEEKEKDTAGHLTPEQAPKLAPIITRVSDRECNAAYLIHEELRHVLSHYHISNVYNLDENPNVNMIEYATNNNASCEDVYEKVIKGFDLNNVQVGICLSSLKIIYTEHFINFLHSQQLKVINYITSSNTCIRLMKKSEEISGIDTSNLPHEIDQLSLAIGFIDNVRVHYNKSYIMGNVFTKLHKDFFDSCPSWFRSLFTVSPVLITDYFSMNHDDDNELILELQTKCLYRLIPVDKTQAEKFNDLIAFSEAKNYDDAIRHVGLFIQAMNSGYLTDIRISNLRKFKSIIEQIFPTTNNIQDEKVKGLIVSTFLHWFIKHEIRYDKNSVEKASRLLKRTYTHVRLIIGLLKHSKCNTLATAINVFDKLNYIVKHRKTYLIGYLEGKISQFPVFVLHLFDENISKKQFMEDLEQAFIQNENRAVTPKFCNITQYVSEKMQDQFGTTGTITEIVKKSALFQLGEEEQHCVGGYFELIERDRCSIFKIEGFDMPVATLEIRFNPVRIEQLKCKQNSSPSTGHRIISERIRDQILLLQKDQPEKLAHIGQDDDIF